MPPAPLLRLVPTAPAEVAVWEGVPSFQTLYERHAAYVAQIVVRFLGRNDDVDDVVHDVFLAAMRTLHQVREPSAIKTWLGRIVVRKVSQRLTYRKLRRTVGLDLAPEQALLCPRAGPQEAAELRAVYAWLDRLPVKHRIAWILRYVEEEPLDEVARLCNCSRASAKRWIASAHDALRGWSHE